MKESTFTSGNIYDVDSITSKESMLARIIGRGHLLFRANSKLQTFGMEASRLPLDDYVPPQIQTTLLQTEPYQ
jgi:hypothetical protein